MGAIDRIQEQEETIDKLREKIQAKKDILKDELMIDYRQMEETKERYIQYYHHAPFHLTEDELRDYNDFRDNHQSTREEPDEDGDRTCRRANGFRTPVIFHWTPQMHSHSIVVECPYCHTKRKLGSYTDNLEEREEPDKEVENE